MRREPQCHISLSTLCIQDKNGQRTSRLGKLILKCEIFHHMVTKTLRLGAVKTALVTTRHNVNLSCKSNVTIIIIIIIIIIMWQYPQTKKSCKRKHTRS